MLDLIRVEHRSLDKFQMLDTISVRLNTKIHAPNDRQVSIKRKCHWTNS